MGVNPADFQSDLDCISGAAVLFAGISAGAHLGTFRYNVYIFSGILFTVIAVFGLYGYFYFRYGVEIPLSSVGLVSTNYVTMSIFLAFAAIYPDMEVLLYFIIPIKMKWMAIVYAVMAVYYFVTGSIVERVAIGASLLNFVIFFCRAGT